MCTEVSHVHIVRELSTVLDGIEPVFREKIFLPQLVRELLLETAG